MGIAEDKESKVTKEKLREVLREFELDDDVSKVRCRVLVAGIRVEYQQQQQQQQQQKW